MFDALWLERNDSGTQASVRSLDDAALGDGNVTIDVEWSTINYKDALAITGRSPVVRRFPMIPGIDLAGVVRQSTHGGFHPGDRVVLNGWGYGEQFFGGLAGRARVDGDKLLALPSQLDTHAAMAIGTAGYTAMLCVLALERNGVQPSQGEVLVTGAGGGVGGFAVALLARRGFRVVASTGRPAEAGRLQRLGAAEILPRDALSQPGKPLAKERWAGVVDCVGSHTLVNACAQTRYRGTIAACGLAQGMDLPGSVAPFILRGVTLAGVDSVMAPMHEREQAWARLASDLDAAAIGDLARDIGLSEAIAGAPQVLEGRVAGRLVVRTA